MRNREYMAFGLVRVRGTLPINGKKTIKGGNCPDRIPSTFGKSTPMLDIENWTTGGEMARWSEPLIADQACGEYERHLGGKNGVSESLGRRHCHMWRHLLEGELRSAQSARHDLLELAQTVDLDKGKLEAINTAILEDLLSVISRRSHSSRKTARLAGMSLMQAAMMLNEIWSATKP